MNSQLFGTDGIRGPAGTYPLDHEGMLQIGKAVGAYFTKPGGKVLVGWDPRESSESLVNAAVEGLVAMGADVRKVGVIPTPGLAYLTKHENAKAGVMITASHNPYTDNGVKVFTPDGRKLPDKAQAGLNELIDGAIETRGQGRVSDDPEEIKIYEDFLVGSAKDTRFEGLSVAVDSANGATSGIAERVFDRLGAHVSPMFDKPDGRNINVNCGATDTAALQEAVRSRSLDAGVALDGDGDRLVMVDNQGRQLTGDHIMYILAVTGGHKGVAATIMSNQGLETALTGQGIDVRRTPVGDRAVLADLEKTGYELGGEQSGHIIMRRYNGTGDGLLAAILTLKEVKNSAKTLAAWRDELKLLPQALVSIPFPDKSALEREEIKRFIASQSQELSGKGRLNVRTSGTEPKVRIMVEAPDAEVRAREIANKLKELAT
jgi:phosphoglucosamine mutase